MIAVALLGILTFGVLGSMVVGFNSDRSTQEIVRCQQYAQRVLETVKSVPYAQVPSLSGTSTVSGDFTSAISVSTLSTGLLRIEIDVTHSTRADVTANVVTLLADLN